MTRKLETNELPRALAAWVFGVDEAVSSGPKLVTAAIIVDQSRLLMAQRAASDPLALKWELPGGKIEQSETPEEALERELREECAVTAFVGKHYATSDYAYAFGHIRLLAYHVILIRGTLDLNVHEQVRWVTPSEAGEMDLLPADVPLVDRLIEEPDLRVLQTEFD